MEENATENTKKQLDLQKQSFDTQMQDHKKQIDSQRQEYEKKQKDLQEYALFRSLTFEFFHHVTHFVFQEDR